MSRVRAVFAAKLRDTREAIERMQQLERDLAQSLGYLESCCACAPTHVRTDCCACDQQGHDPARTPDLVAGLALPERAARFDVAVEHLTGGR